MNNFERELTQLINKYSLENVSNTPDFILATYMMQCLDAYNTAVDRRTHWWRDKAKEVENNVRATQ